MDLVQYIQKGVTMQAETTQVQLDEQSGTQMSTTGKQLRYLTVGGKIFQVYEDTKDWTITLFT